MVEGAGEAWCIAVDPPCSAAHQFELTCNQMQTRIAKTTLSISGALYLVCLTQDGYYIDGPDPEAWAPAYGLLIAGWLGMFAGVFAWLANPLLFASWYLLTRSRHGAAFFVSSGALLFATSFLLQPEVISSTKPTYSQITGYGVGYWLWITSVLVVMVGTGALSLGLTPGAPAVTRADEREP